MPSSVAMIFNNLVQMPRNLATFWQKKTPLTGGTARGSNWYSDEQPYSAARMGRQQ